MKRHRRRSLPQLAVVLLGLVTSVESQAQADETWQADGAIDDSALFVVGNTLFAVYHELGHALIELLNLPVIGREEDAVDGFAAVTMIPETPDLVQDALIVAVADGWRMQSDLASDGSDRRYWDEHALDAQRHFAIVCLMVGSDQAGFQSYALDAGLPEERIETCAHDFANMKSGWDRLLDPFEPDLKPEDKPAESSLALVFDQPLPDQEKVADLVMQGGLLEAAITSFGERIALPSPVMVRFTPCEDPNAYWSPSERQVTVCYELIDEFEAILLGALVR